MQLGGPGPYFCGRRGISLLLRPRLAVSKFKHRALKPKAFPRRQSDRYALRRLTTTTRRPPSLADHARVEQCGRARTLAIVDEILLRRSFPMGAVRAWNDATTPLKRAGGF